MSDFSNEHYRVFFRNVNNKNYFEINSSSEQSKAKRNINKYGPNDPCVSIEVSYIAEKYLLGRREITKELIYDLASTATFHLHHGDTDEVYKILADKYLKE